MSAPSEVPIRLTIEAGKAGELARALGLDPALLGGVALPTHYVVINHQGTGFMNLMSDVLEAGGHVLHGEEEVEFPNGPVGIGEELEGEIRVLDRTQTEGRSGPFELVRLLLELRRADGEVAVAVKRTLIARPGH